MNNLLELPSEAKVLRSKIVATSSRSTTLKRLSRGAFNNSRLEADMERAELRSGQTGGFGSWRGTKGSSKASAQFHALEAIRALTRLGTKNPESSIAYASEALWHAWCAAELCSRPQVVIVLEGNFSSGKSTVLDRLSKQGSLASCIVKEPNKETYKERVLAYHKEIGSKKFVLVERSPFSLAFSNLECLRQEKDKNDFEADLTIILNVSKETCLKRTPTLDESLVETYGDNLSQVYTRVYPHSEIVSIDAERDIETVYMDVLGTLRFFADYTIPEII